MVRKILIADDHDLVRESLKKYVGMAFPDAQVIEAIDYPSLVHVLQERDVDFVICDYVMPGMNALKSVQVILDTLKDRPLVMISGLAPIDDVVAALRLGARGFLYKTLAPEAMVRALQLVASGEVYVPSNILDVVSFTKDISTPVKDEIDILPDADGRIFEKLTGRETEILHFLTEGHSNKDIARALKVQEITIKVHLKNIYRKLKVTNRTQAANLAFRLGFVTPR